MSRMLAKLAIALVVVACVAVSAIAVPSWSRSRAGSLPTAVVQQGTFVDYLQVRGEIRPVRSVVLTAPMAGGDMQIVDLVANGATVAQGDPVVQFDSTTQQRMLEQKRSEVKQAESEIAKAEAEARRRVQAAETEWAQGKSAAARARLDLGRQEFVSRAEAEKLTLTLANLEHQVKAVEQKVEGERAAAAADVALARRKRDKARYDLADTERIIGSLSLRAPAAGTISLLPNTRAGGPMARSAPEFKRGDRVWFGAPIAELPDLSEIQLTCRLDEADRARVQIGAGVLVKVDAVPDRELQASLQHIGLIARPEFTSWPPVRNFDVVIRLDEVDARLRPGMSASARIELERFADALLVPTTAVYQVNGATVVYVVDGGSVETRPVTVRRRGRDQVAIASGVAPGERVALQQPPSEAAR